MRSLWWQCALGTLVRDKTLVHSQLIFHHIVLMNIFNAPFLNLAILFYDCFVNHWYFIAL